MSESATYSLWMMPAGELANRLKEQIIELSVEHETPEFPPHVTLIGQLRPPESELIQHTNTLANSAGPLELTLTEVDYLDRFYQSLFIQVKESQKLKEIRNAACNIFRVSNKYYMPHLSLLYGDVSDEEKELTTETVGREFHLDLPIKELVLMQTNGEPDQWKKIHSAAL